jgi:hypothetical protein
VVGLVLVFGVACLVALTVVRVRGSRGDRVRIDRLQEWAQLHGFSYSAHEPRLVSTYSFLPQATKDRRPQIRNVVRGRFAGRVLTAFDYSHQDSASRDPDKYTYRFRAIAFEVRPGRATIQVSPRDLGSKLVLKLGGQDARIGDAKFDKAFRVITTDEVQARRVLAPIASALRAHPDQHVWITGSTVLMLRAGTLDQAQLGAWSEELLAVVEQVVPA